ncbi:MAG: hypothetical protein ACLQRM_07250, partial [Acidimicrobiales bacterium]
MHEVACLGEAYERTSGGVADVDDVVLITDTGDPRVLDTRGGRPTASSRSRPSIRYGAYATAMLMIAYTFSFLDRQILNLMVGPI